MREPWFQRTEKLLYDYKTFNAAIRVLEAERKRLLGPLSEDIMPPLGTSVVKLGQGSTKTPFDTSQTERWGIKRAEMAIRRMEEVDKELLNLYRWRDGIREARKTLTPLQQEFVKLKYDQEKTRWETWSEIKQIIVATSESSYHRLRRETLRQVNRVLEKVERGRDG